MIFSIDRFEGNFAVVITENDEQINIPKVLLKNGAEGDFFEIIKRDDEKDKQKEKINKLMDELWND